MDTGCRDAEHDGQLRPQVVPIVSGVGVGSGSASAYVSSEDQAPTMNANTSVELVEFRVDRQRDGKAYETPVNERYSLGADGNLTYSAYYGEMPTNMNHMDSVSWNAGDLGKIVLDAARRVAADPGLAADLSDVPDGVAEPMAGSGLFRLTLRSLDVDATRIVSDPERKAYGVLDVAFQELIEAFRKETGRPIAASALPIPDHASHDARR